jgi:acyl carrier protein
MGSKEKAPIVTSDRLDRQALRAHLLALIAESVPNLEGDLTDDTPLITSGFVESITLLNMALWVEEHIDSTVEITAFDLSAEWDTVTDILNFVERHRDSSPATGTRRRD